MTAAEPPLRRANGDEAPNFRRRRLGALAALIALLLAGYLLAVGLAPLPGLDLTLSPATQGHAAGETSVELGGSTAQDAVNAQRLPTAIGWSDDGGIWSNDDTAYPIASITKLVTVLVGLEARPLEPGENGLKYTYSEADRAREPELRRLDAIMHPVPVGTEFSTRELLELMLLPSSNDYAIAYANWVFGDNAGYRSAVEAWAKRHGLDSLRVVEPSGLDAGNVANAADLVRLGRIALKNQTVLEITRMRSATIPGVGKVRSTNPLLGAVKGVTGLKTGSLDAVGFNLLASQRVKVKGRELVQLTATLARPTREARAASGAEMLDEMAGLPKRKRLVTAREELGSVTSWQGERIALVAADDARTVLLPGESATRTVSLGAVGAGPSGSTVGEIRITAPTDAPIISIVTDGPIVEPDFWWRALHPMQVFGLD